MYQKQELLAQLAAMGVPSDRVVLIHSSLRAVGAVEGGGETVLDALVEHITADGGLCCLPTHTWHLMGKHDLPTLDLTKAETCVGALTRIALCDGRGTRTLNPTHSMVVFGKRERVAEFVRGEEKQRTHTSPEGCYGKLYREDGFVLLLGVGHKANTFLHCVEEMLDVKNRLAPTPIPVSVKYPNGETVHREVVTFDETYGDVSRRFPKFEPAFRAHGCIADGFVGDAPTQLCSARGMKDVLETIYTRAAGREILADDEPLDAALYEREDA